MPSVIPLDHRPSCFSKLFSSHLRALCRCMRTTCNYYGCACASKWPTTITIIRFSFALLNDVLIFSISKYLIFELPFIIYCLVNMNLLIPHGLDCSRNTMHPIIPSTQFSKEKEDLVVHSINRKEKDHRNKSL